MWNVSSITCFAKMLFRYDSLVSLNMALCFKKNNLKLLQDVICRSKSFPNIRRAVETIDSNWSYSKTIHTSAYYSFFEYDLKAGYRRDTKMPSRIDLVRDGFKELKNEINLWTDEVQERINSDPILTYRFGETDILWKFDSPEVLLKWVATSDSDNKNGFSKCNFIISPNKTGLFEGELNSEIPKDGNIKRSGYCNIRSQRIRKSFKRDSYYDWRQYSHLVMRVRGDGRTYIINLSTEGYYDIMWNDIYSYALYTRGGPYWQVTKIPFSKFFLTSKGRVQDKQSQIPLNRVTHVGISLADRVKGSFSLEVDYIGLEFDQTHTEKFAYEMYNLPSYLAGY